MLLGHSDLEHYPGVPRVSAYKYASKNGEKIIEETKLHLEAFFWHTPLLGTKVNFRPPFVLYSSLHHESINTSDYITDWEQIPKTIEKRDSQSIEGRGRFLH